VGDMLDVTVFDNADLSVTATVQTDGALPLPLLGEVPVAGMTVAEVQARVTTLLERDYLVNPQVTVRVKEYRSQFVFVVGEMTKTGRHALKGATRLIDLLVVEAGGLTARASGDIVVTRSSGTFDDGTKTLKLRLRPGDLSPENQLKLETPLRSGDIITAAPKDFVVVDGEVMRPGRFVLEEGLTVTGAISLAGGLTRFGSHDVKVRRTDLEGGPPRVIEVDLKSIRNGKQPDLPLEANDVVTAPRKLF